MPTCTKNETKHKSKIKEAETRGGANTGFITRAFQERWQFTKRQQRKNVYVAVGTFEPDELVVKNAFHLRP